MMHSSLQVMSGSNRFIFSEAETAWRNSATEDSKPAPYTRSWPSCLHNPNSTVKKYNCQQKTEIIWTFLDRIFPKNLWMVLSFSNDNNLSCIYRWTMDIDNCIIQKSLSNVSITSTQRLNWTPDMVVGALCQICFIYFLWNLIACIHSHLNILRK